MGVEVHAETLIADIGVWVLCSVGALLFFGAVMSKWPRP